MSKISRPRDKSKKKNVSTKSSADQPDHRYFPYARGFKPADRPARLRAVGFAKGSVPPQFDPDTPASDGFKFFDSIPRPTSEDDWLAQYCEDGQTYSQYLRECPWLSPRKVKYIHHQFVPGGKTLGDRYPQGKIYIVQVGDFSVGGCPVPFAELVDYAGHFLGLPIATLPAVNLVEEGGSIFWQEGNAKDDAAPVQMEQRRSGRIRRHTMQIRHNSKSGWTQIAVDSLLRRLQVMIPHDAFCLVGLTMYDLYADDPDLFVAGMAAGLNRVAVFSLRRYDPRLTFSPEFWYDVKATEEVSDEGRQKLMVARSSRLLVHEVCHLLGLDHCVFFACAMNGSGHLSEDFSQPMHLCPVCLRKLHTLVGMDIQHRYTQLLHFYKRHGLTADQDWVKRRLAFLENAHTDRDSICSPAGNKTC